MGGIGSSERSVVGRSPRHASTRLPSDKFWHSLLIMNLVHSATGRHSYMTGKAVGCKSPTRVQAYTWFTLSCYYVLVSAGRWGDCKQGRQYVKDIITHFVSSLCGHQSVLSCCGLNEFFNEGLSYSYIQTTTESNWPYQHWHIWNNCKKLHSMFVNCEDVVKDWCSECTCQELKTFKWRRKWFYLVIYFQERVFWLHVCVWVHEFLHV